MASSLQVFCTNQFLSDLYLLQLPLDSDNFNIFHPILGERAALAAGEGWCKIALKMIADEEDVGIQMSSHTEPFPSQDEAVYFGCI